MAGYSAAGDGGGGAFYYDAASSDADNGGTIIAPTAGSGRWIRNYSGAVNVRWFGAKGDGVSDDTAGIQAALDTAADVLFPSGTYVTTGLLVPSSGTARITSNGATLRGAGTKANSGITANQALPMSLSIDGLTLENFTIAVYLPDTNVQPVTITVRHCAFSECNRAIWLNGNVTSATIEGNRFSNIINSSNSAAAIALGLLADDTYETSSGDYIVKGNRIRTVGSGGSYEAHAIWLTGTRSIVSNNIISDIYNTGAVGNGAEAIYTKCAFSNISHNTIRDGGSGQGAIVVKGDVRNGVDASNAFGFGALVCSNIITGETPEKSNIGIGVFTSDALVSGNRIENMMWQSGAYVNGAAICVNNAAVDNVHVVDNAIAVSKTRQAIHFRAAGRGNRCDRNVIDGVTGSAGDSGTLYGIYIQLTAASISDMSCIGNRVYVVDDVDQNSTGVRAISFIQAAGATYSNVTISDNLCKVVDQGGVSYGVEVSGGDATTTQSSLRLTGNSVYGNPDSQFVMTSATVRTNMVDIGNSWNAPAAPLASATAANLGSAAHAINTTNKYLGREVYDTTNGHFLRASGSGATAVWKNMNGGSDITPA